MSRRITILCGLALSACVTGPQPLEKLRARSAFDLQCDPKKVRLVYIDDSTQGAIGCGQRLVYVERCDDPYRMVGTCTWVLNSDSRTQRRSNDE